VSVFFILTFYRLCYNFYMNESFGAPENSPEKPDAEPLSKKTESEDSFSSNTEDFPEFNEYRIDREKLRKAIEIAQYEKTA
jgi:hypothetical protein